VADRGVEPAFNCAANGFARACLRLSRSAPSAWSNPDFDAKIAEALGVADAEKRKPMMKDMETMLQQSGIIIQPYWRKLYSHSVKAVQNYKMHPTFERDYGKIWLDQA